MELEPSNPIKAKEISSLLSSLHFFKYIFIYIYTDGSSKVEIGSLCSHFTIHVTVLEFYRVTGIKPMTE